MLKELQELSKLVCPNKVETSDGVFYVQGITVEQWNKISQYDKGLDQDTCLIALSLCDKDGKPACSSDEELEQVFNMLNRRFLWRRELSEKVFEVNGLNQETLKKLEKNLETTQKQNG